MSRGHIYVCLFLFTVLGTQWFLSSKRLGLCVWFCGQWLGEHKRLGWEGHVLFLIHWLHRCVLFPPRKKTRIPVGTCSVDPFCHSNLSNSLHPVLMIPHFFFLINSFSPFSPFFLRRLQLVRCWNSWIGPSMLLCLFLCFSPLCVWCMYACACQRYP